MTTSRPVHMLHLHQHQLRRDRGARSLHTSWHASHSQSYPELDELEALRARTRASDVPETFGSQIEPGIRINSAIRDWLREQTAATAD